MLSFLPCIVVGTTLFAADAAPATEVQCKTSENRVEVERGPISLVFDPSGRGALSEAKLGGALVGKASAASGLFATLIEPEPGCQPFQPIRGQEIAATVKVGAVTGKKTDHRAEVASRG
jgi:hypothetical protein